MTTYLISTYVDDLCAEPLVERIISFSRGIIAALIFTPVFANK